MRPTSVARWVLPAAAAGGQKKAAGKYRSGRKNRGKRKPEDFFGHRKAARSDNPEIGRRYRNKYRPIIT